MEVILCVPGLDLQLESLEELDIRQYLNKDLWQTPSLDYFLNKGIHIHKPFSHSKILSDYILIDDLKSLIIKELNLDNNNFIFVSPVFQNMQLNSMHMLYGNNLLNIRLQEAHVLCNDLNQFFNDENINFYPYTPNLWILKLDKKIKWNSIPIMDYMGMVNYESKPTGSDYKYILKIQNEISMFLFHHNLNKDRESKNLPSINGVCLWDDIKGKANRNNTLIYTNLDYLSSYNNVYRSNDFNKWDDVKSSFDLKNINRIVVYIDFVFISIIKLDLNLHIKGVNLLENLFLKPILKDFNNGIIDEISIISNASNGGILTVNKITKKLKFWQNKFKYQGKWFK